VRCANENCGYLSTYQLAGVKPGDGARADRDDALVNSTAGSRGPPRVDAARLLCLAVFAAGGGYGFLQRMCLVLNTVAPSQSMYDEVVKEAMSVIAIMSKEELQRTLEVCKRENIVSFTEDTSWSSSSVRNDAKFAVAFILDAKYKKVVAYSVHMQEFPENVSRINVQALAGSAVKVFDTTAKALEIPTVKSCLQFLHDAGVPVRILTTDGNCALVSLFGQLKKDGILPAVFQHRLDVNHSLKAFRNRLSKMLEHFVGEKSTKGSAGFHRQYLLSKYAPSSIISTAVLLLLENPQLLSEARNYVKEPGAPNKDLTRILRRLSVPISKLKRADLLARLRNIVSETNSKLNALAGISNETNATATDVVQEMPPFQTSTSIPPVPAAPADSGSSIAGSVATYLINQPDADEVDLDICPICSVNTDDDDMVQCSECTVWVHISCAQSVCHVSGKDDGSEKNSRQYLLDPRLSMEEITADGFQFLCGVCKTAVEVNRVVPTSPGTKPLPAAHDVSVDVNGAPDPADTQGSSAVVASSTSVPDPVSLPALQPVPASGSQSRKRGGPNSLYAPELEGNDAKTGNTPDSWADRIRAYVAHLISAAQLQLQALPIVDGRLDVPEEIMTTFLQKLRNGPAHWMGQHEHCVSTYCPAAASAAITIASTITTDSLASSSAVEVVATANNEDADGHYLLREHSTYQPIRSAHLKNFVMDELVRYFNNELKQVLWGSRTNANESLNGTSKLVFAPKKTFYPATFPTRMSMVVLHHNQGNRWLLDLGKRYCENSAFPFATNPLSASLAAAIERERVAQAKRKQGPSVKRARKVKKMKARYARRTGTMLIDTNASLPGEAEYEADIDENNVNSDGSIEEGAEDSSSDAAGEYLELSSEEDRLV